MAWAMLSAIFLPDRICTQAAVNEDAVPEDACAMSDVTSSRNQLIEFAACVHGVKVVASANMPIADEDLRNR